MYPLIIIAIISLVGAGLAFWLFLSRPADQVAKLFQNGGFLLFGLLALALFMLRLPILALFAGVIAVSMWRKTMLRFQRQRHEPQSKPVFHLDRLQALTLLGLSQGATKAEIHKAYKEKMKQHHPDNGGDGQMAQRLNAARDLLLDDKN